jgi:hypothetical protein
MAIVITGAILGAFIVRFGLREVHATVHFWSELTGCHTIDLNARAVQGPGNHESMMYTGSPLLLGCRELTPPRAR